MLAQRVVTALVLGAVVAGVVLFAPVPVVLVLLGLLWAAGAWEWAQFARLPGGQRLVYALAIAVAMVPAFWPFEERLAVLALSVALLWWAIAFAAVVTYPRPYGRAAAAIAGLVTLLPPWFVFAYLLRLEPLGRELVLAAFVIVWAADIGAYACGRRFGRRKLAPAVSPGKTWEGVSGGLAAAGLVGALVAWRLGLPVGVLLAIALVTALVSVLGDLNVSLFKRNVGLKDSGRLLPGHGGVLDRIDSLTAAVPVFALGLELAGLLG